MSTLTHFEIRKTFLFLSYLGIVLAVVKKNDWDEDLLIFISEVGERINVLSKVTK